MRLTDFAADTYSQFGEDGMLAYIFSQIGVGGRVCVEFGAADGSSCSNTALLWRNKWSAVLIEGNSDLFQRLQHTIQPFHHHVLAVNTYLTPTGPCTVDNVLSNNNVTAVDFMSIDVDGIDYQIWEAMACRPRVVCIEYNQSIPPHVSLHQKDLSDSLGASAKALVELADRKDYFLVGMNKANLFFVVAEEIEELKHLQRDLLELFPYEGLAYAATDYRSRAFIVGMPPWGIAPEPYIGETEGDPVYIMGPKKALIRAVEADHGVPAVFIGQSWEVSPSARTDVGVAAYSRLFGSDHPLVILDVENQSDLEACRWVEGIAAKWGYTLSILRKDLFVFHKQDHPVLSIVIVNYFHPEVIDVCLRTLAQTEGVPYEVIVVDNGSDIDTVRALEEHRSEGRIDKLQLETTNHMFSMGNNIGVAASNPESEYILLLNSDVGFLRPDWLSKMFAWMRGTAVARPTVWGLVPTIAHEGPRDIVSIGWTHDAAVLPGRVRPEGWCCLLRRKWWRDMSADFPFHYGFEEMIASAVREGAKIGVLSQYAKYLVHKEGGSGRAENEPVQKRTPDIPGWFNGLEIESLDFTLGPDEHSSYMEW